MGKVQSYEDLISLFDLNKKVGLKGLKYVNIHTSKDSNIHTTYITPVNLVENLMDKFSASSAQKQEVIALYNQIKNKSSKINRSRPQSVSAGLIWFWICQKGMEITLKEFAVKTGLSELTINKIAKEIAEILKVPYLH
jgi:transcription initiation factor TFIIIB Brf1 subunit/transcription initiation factor TFIIB